MLGSETMLKDLRVDHGALRPAWDPMRHGEYDIQMDTSSDLVRFHFQRVDSGQIVSLESEPETCANSTSPTPRQLFQVQGNIGEIQHEASSLVATLDVGCRRKLHLQVRSADEAHSLRHSFVVHRAPCPNRRPFFDGQASVCTDICNAGFLGSTSTGRCVSCGQEHCAVCEVEGFCSECADGFMVFKGECRPEGHREGALAEAEAAVTQVPTPRVLIFLAVAVLAGLLLACAWQRYPEKSIRRSGGALGRDEGSSEGEFGAFEDDAAYQG